MTGPRPNSVHVPRRTVLLGAAPLGLGLLTACGTRFTPGSAPMRRGSTAPAAATKEAERCVPTSGSAVPADVARRLQDVLDDSRARMRLPGVVARAITPEWTWTGSAGVAAAGGTAPPTASDHTRIGSLTKTMTATILLQLVQEGTLTLHQRVSRYLPRIPNGDATLLQVADMTSGIPSYTLDDAVTERYLTSPERPWTTAELLDAVRTLPARFPTGHGWEYSNSNYVILGAIISMVLGEPLPRVFHDRLFRPLGMTESSYPTSAALPAPHLSGITMQGSTGGKPRDATAFDPSFAGAAGQVVSTLDDLQRWARALFTGDRVLSPRMQRLRRDSILTTPPPNTPTAGYGIGIGDRNGWWGHDGDIPGYTTSVFHHYGTSTTIIAVANSDIEDPTSHQAPAPAVFGAMVGAVAHWRPAGHGRGRRTELPRRISIDSFTDETGQLGTLTGIIEGPDGQMWFASTGTDRVGRLDPVTGTIQTFKDPAGRLRGPANLITGADGRIWFTCPQVDALGRIDPFAADPQASMTAVTASGLRNPVAIRSAADGRIWCSLRSANALASLDPRSADPAGSLRILTHRGIDRPAAIFPEPGGRLWFTTTARRPGIGSLDTRARHPARTVTTFTPPRVGALRAWAKDTDGRLWVTTREPGCIARFDPAHPRTTWQHFTGREFSAPDGATAGPDGAIWAVDSARGSILRVETTSGAVDEWAGDLSVSAPFDLKPGPDGTLWFTNRGVDSIGRIRSA